MAGDRAGKKEIRVKSIQMSSSGLVRRLLLGLAIGFAVLLVLLFLGDVRQVRQQMLAFRWQLFPLVLGLTLLNYTLRFFKWHYYLGQIGVKGLALGESARLFAAGFPLAVTPGKVGEVLKAVWLNQKTGITVAAGVAVVLAERISDGLAVVLLSTAGIFANSRYWPAIVLILAALMSLVALTQSRQLVTRILDFAQRLSPLQKLTYWMREFYEGSYLLFRPKSTLLAIGLGTISWLGEGVGFYLILLGLGIPPGWEVLGSAVFILAFSTLVGAISTMPGGLGAAEASITGMLILILDLDTTTAASATLLIRFATLWFGVTLGLVTWAFSPNLLGQGASIDPSRTAGLLERRLP
jgi:uncharacterized protein (TIRG00374 family)